MPDTPLLPAGLRVLAEGPELVAQIEGGFLCGVAVDGDGYAYACDIHHRRVVRIAPDGEVVAYGGRMGYPNYQPNRIDRLTLEGVFETVVDDWSGWEVAMPTNIAFAGPDLEIMVVANLGGWFVSAFDPGVRGAPLHYPRLVP